MDSSEWNSAQKLQIVLEGLNGKTAEELTAAYGITSDELDQWTAHFMRHASTCFEEEEKGNSSAHTIAINNPTNFSDLVKSIPHAVFCKDLEGYFTYGNPAYCSIMKIDESELIGKNDFDLHTPAAANKYRADDNLVIQLGDVYSCQEQNVHTDGTILWAEVVKAPIRDEHGNITGIMGMFWDITKQKRTESELLEAQETLEFRVEKRTIELFEANKRLEEGNRLKDIFLSSASHELRTPLTSILGFSRLITRDAVKTKELPLQDRESLEKYISRISENASIISEEGSRLKRLIDDLLDLGKIESGKMTWAGDVIDLNHVAKASIAAMRGQYATKPNVELIESLAQHPILVMADADRIKQIFINLLNNAAKFTHDGHVKVTVTAQDNRWAEVCVSDTGIGISNNDIALIFEHYYQGMQPIVHDKGTGLGLSICHQIIKHYEGKFWVESSQGHGTNFFFRLPLITCDLE